VRTYDISLNRCIRLFKPAMYGVAMQFQTIRRYNEMNVKTMTHMNVSRIAFLHSTPRQDRASGSGRRVTYAQSEIPPRSAPGILQIPCKHRAVAANNSRPKSMLISILRHPRKLTFISFAIRNMSGGVSYAAAVSTPNGSVRQPQIESRACSDPDLRSSFEAQTAKKTQSKPQRPGAGIRSKTSFRGWASKKGRESEGQERGAAQEVHHAFVPRAEYQPSTGGNEEHVYVLTFKLEDSLSAPMNEMRKQYFPKRLNRIPAHLTLFRALPHSHIESLEESLSQVSLNTQPFQVTTGGPFRMRKGVGVNVDAGYQNLKEVHGQLRSQWMSFLSEQDQGGFRPHWTVMNKVDEEQEVENALGAVRKELSQSTKEGQAVGLDLWKYDRGNWIWAKEYTFGAPKSSSSGSNGVSPLAKNGSPGGGPGKRPGVKRGNSVAEAWRSMSFRRKS
jgi:2'-5' RNA ligase